MCSVWIGVKLYVTCQEVLRLSMAERGPHVLHRNLSELRKLREIEVLRKGRINWEEGLIKCVFLGQASPDIGTE